MEFPPDIATAIQNRFELLNRDYPAAISADGRAMMVDGGIGHYCYVSPDGDIYYESWADDEGKEWITDRSREAQIKVLVLGSRTVPELKELLPERGPDSMDCAPCEGKGFIWSIFICDDCCGLGWL